MNKYKIMSDTIINIRDIDNIKQHIDDKVCPIEKELFEINSHLKTLNGSVAKNTEFRNKLTGGFILVGFLGITNVVMIVIFIFKTFHL